MEQWVTIAVFTLPTQLGVVKGRLESEGIPCFVRDELTVQSYNFLSNAVGGIKLQVPGSDTDRAKAILRSGGYPVYETPPMPVFWQRFDEATRGLPLIGSRLIELRFLFLLAIAVLSLLVLLLLVTESLSST